jgi:hypothetical protein
MADLVQTQGPKSSAVDIKGIENLQGMQGKHHSNCAGFAE